MMEMDDLDSVRCQKSRKRDMMGILKMFNDNETKDEQCSSSSIKRPKNVRGWKWGCSGWIFDFLERERESTFSPDFQPIGLSVLDGARSKVALRGDGYAWAPIWWCSDNSKR